MVVKSMIRQRRDYTRALIRRAEHLTTRIAVNADYSYDKLERNALVWVLGLVRNEYELLATSDDETAQREAATILGELDKFDARFMIDSNMNKERR